MPYKWSIILVSIVIEMVFYTGCVYILNKWQNDIHTCTYGIIGNCSLEISSDKNITIEGTGLENLDRSDLASLNRTDLASLNRTDLTSVDGRGTNCTIYFENIEIVVNSDSEWTLQSNFPQNTKCVFENNVVQFSILVWYMGTIYAFHKVGSLIYAIITLYFRIPLWIAMCVSTVSVLSIFFWGTLADIILDDFSLGILASTISLFLSTMSGLVLVYLFTTQQHKGNISIAY